MEGKTEKSRGSLYEARYKIQEAKGNESRKVENLG